LVYKAGQYVSVYFDKNKDSQGKFYTISSSPSEKYLTLSVKKTGRFSSALHNLKIKNLVYLSGPYGWFYPETEMDHLVFLAAGIGITPFLSIIKDNADKNVKKKITLYYTNETFKDVVFLKEINQFVKNNFLQAHYYLTRDNIKHKLISKHERIKAENIKRELTTLANNNFYICGPIVFVSEMRKQLIKLKVKENNIFTESFF
jgi:ferredoxin-NADP reductase